MTAKATVVCRYCKTRFKNPYREAKLTTWFSCVKVKQAIEMIGNAFKYGYAYAAKSREYWGDKIIKLSKQ